MAVYPDGTIIEGGLLPATDAIPTIAGKGCIFTNVTFYNPSQFGEGCIFVGCTFIDINGAYNTQPHRMGYANVFTDCTFNYVIFGEANISNTNPIGGYRPNQGSPLFDYKSSTTPKLSASHCPQCGAIVISHNGEFLVNESMLPKEEHLGHKGDCGQVKSSGLCAKCSG